MFAVCFKERYAPPGFQQIISKETKTKTALISHHALVTWTFIYKDSILRLSLPDPHDACHFVCLLVFIMLLFSKADISFLNAKWETSQKKEPINLIYFVNTARTYF